MAHLDMTGGHPSPVVAAAARRTAVALALCGAFLLLPALPAQAETMSWLFRSNHPNIVDVELYSQSRDHVWPGGDKVFVLDDGQTTEFAIDCSAGEDICYGAWVRGDANAYWGVGLDDEEACESCCYVCEAGETEVIVLDP
ncbi:hypothetical protein [Stappia sp.]|uniref:hypothetical protein n=1 Tax=Stappia sp. TaxID=1870903 RepID=UPI0032D929C4